MKTVPSLWVESLGISLDLGSVYIIRKSNGFPRSRKLDNGEYEHKNFKLTLIQVCSPGGCMSFQECPNHIKLYGDMGAICCLSRYLLSISYDAKIRKVKDTFM